MRRPRTAQPPAVDPNLRLLPKTMDPPRLGKALHFTPFPRPPSSAPKAARCDRLATAAAAAALAVFLLAAVARSSWSRGRRGYAVIVDGGSTGTRIHVFEYREDGGEVAVDLKRGGVASLKVVPGLSSYRGDPEGAGRSLGELLEFARGKVPRVDWERTEVRLMCTAGLRLLEVGVQDRILESCRRVLRSSGFQFRDDWASVITGSEEGVYAWLAANYALGSLGDDPWKTTGIIELGGASAQVTFVSSDPLPPEFSHTLKFGRHQYNLYSHSLLHFGQNVAYDLFRESLTLKDVSSVTFDEARRLVDPCTPRGYEVDALKLSSNNVVAGGNFTGCRSAALSLLRKGKDECLYEHCRLGSNYIPKLHGRFLATENFFYTSKFFKLPSTALLSDILIAGQQFCEEDWQKLRKKYYNIPVDDLLPYCFSSAYIVAMLHDGLGIDLSDDRIEFTNEVNGIPLDWANGAFILQKAAHKGDDQGAWVLNNLIDGSSSFLSMFVIFIVLVFIIWSLLKWKKPQMKTIYDLEKGRYIVRVSR